MTWSIRLQGRFLWLMKGNSVQDVKLAQMLLTSQNLRSSTVGAGNDVITPASFHAQVAGVYFSVHTLLDTTHLPIFHGYQFDT